LIRLAEGVRWRSYEKVSQTTGGGVDNILESGEGESENDGEIL
jgi:hypothetical protein